MTLRGTFRKPFPEQIAAFRVRLGNLVPTQAWDDIQRAQHDRAFMVAGAQKADLLADLARAVDRAIAEGVSLEEFRRDFRDIVERNGWHGWTGEGTKAGEAWRTRVIYRTNAKVSYAAGRMAQLRDGAFPYWIYFHGGSAEPRIQHLSWNGLVLPSDHPFWAVAYPPNGWGCSCYVSGARSLRAAERLGGDPSKELPPGWNSTDPRTGAPPGIDKGWDYAPGASSADLVSQMAEKAVDWRYSLSVAFFRDLPESQRDALQEAYRRLPSLGDKLRRYVQRIDQAAGTEAQDLLKSEPIVSIGLITRAQKSLLGNQAGDIARYDWAVSGERVMHALRRHSNLAVENARGQLPIGATDFSRLPAVIEAPDSFEWIGKDADGIETLEIRKAFGGRLVVALFRRRPRFQRLELATLFVKKIR